MCLESLAFDHRQRRRAAWLLASLMVMLAGLGLRVVHINTSKAPDLLRFAERQQRGHSVIAARRGMILDARGRTVALSRYMPDVFVDPSLVGDVDALAALLGVRLNLSAGDIATSIRRRPHSPTHREPSDRRGRREHSLGVVQPSGVGGLVHEWRGQERPDGENSVPHDETSENARSDTPGALL